MADVAPRRHRDFIDLSVGQETWAVQTFPATEEQFRLVTAPVLRRCDGDCLIIGNASRKVYLVFLLLAAVAGSTYWAVEKMIERGHPGHVVGWALVVGMTVVSVLKLYLQHKKERYRLEVCFDRKTGQVGWKGQAWADVSLGDIVAVQLLVAEKRAGEYQLILILKGLPWARRRQLAQHQDLLRIRQLSRQLSDFLKVPLLDHTRDEGASEGDTGRRGGDRAGAADRELMKVFVELRDAPVETESLWAKPLGGDLYELRNTPGYAFDLHFHDMVRAVPDQPGEKPRIVEVVRPSGHNTLRVSFQPEVDEAERLEKLRWLHRWRVSYERCNDRLYAIDVEPDADYGAVCTQLSLWKLEGLLAYNTGTTRKDRA